MAHFTNASFFLLETFTHQPERYSRCSGSSGTSKSVTPPMAHNGGNRGGFGFVACLRQYNLKLR